MSGDVRRIAAACSGLGLIYLGSFASQAHAGGISLPGIGPVSSSRAGAFVAAADDPSAIGINPAGLAKGTGTVVLIGSNFIDYSLEYTRNGTYDEVTDEDYAWEGERYGTVEDESNPGIGIGAFQAIPLIAISTDLGLDIEGLRFGAGVFAPNAYPARDLNADYQIGDVDTPPPPNRYDVTEEDAAVITPSIAVAYRVHDKLDIGARVSWAFAHLESTNYVWAVGNFNEDPQLDAVFKIKGDDPFVSSWSSYVPPFAIGALYRPTSFLEVGAHFTSQLDISTKGTGTSAQLDKVTETTGPIVPKPDDEAQCEGGGTPEELKACVELGLPMTATIGARYIVRDSAGNERADIELDLTWEHHSATSDYKVVVDAQTDTPNGGAPVPIQDTFIRHGFQDTIGVRLGGSYRIPVGANQAIVRGGVAYDTAAAEDEWERLDLDGAARTTLALGAAFRASRFQVDIGGGAVLEGTRDVGVGCNPANSAAGCSGMGRDAIADRTAPDPAQPAQEPGSQAQSPFNEGTYKSHYLMFMLGLSTWF